METENKQSSWATPVAIVLAGAIIAGAVYLKGNNAPADGQVAGAANSNLEKFAEVESKDHLRGSTSAKIKLVEYSDLECPFCKAFHAAMIRVMAKQNAGDANNLAWVYRHFPLDSIHPKARQEAEAAECAGEQGGGNAFWSYVDKIFASTPSNNGLDLALLPNFATEIGLDKTKFETCLTSGKMAEVVEEQFQTGTTIGVDGTPFVVVISASGEKFMPFKNAIPTDADPEVKTLITDLLTTYQEEINKLR